MTIHASNPFDSYKFAVLTALGGRCDYRPIFKERGVGSITLADGNEDYFFLFEDLNYEYINSLPLADVVAFSDENYGTFFYEFGRAILANLSICLTKADWNSVDYNYEGGAASYVGEYYHALITLRDKVPEVIEQFRKEVIKESGEYSKFNFKFDNVVEDILKAKEVAASAKDSKDMANANIFLDAYIGITFVLYGLIILMGRTINDKDVFSFMKAPTSSQSDSLFQDIFVKSNLGEEEKKHLLSIMYTFWRTTRFYKRVSGYSEVDGVIGLLFDFTNRVMSGLDSTSEKAEELRELLDKDLIDESFANGLSIQTFTDDYDILSNMLYFKSATIIEHDCADIFKFGAIYLACYETKDEEENSLFDKVSSPIRTYMKSSLKSRYSNEDVEKCFTEVKNLLTGVEVDDMAKVNPGEILWLVFLASAFRLIRERSTERSNIAHNEINGAIDILDILIIKLYDTWFNSKKYYVQVKRPNYTGNDGVQSTLSVLKAEVDNILANYLEFVRFGLKENVSEEDKHLYSETKKQILYTYLEGTSWKEDTIDGIFPVATGTDEFVRNCASKNGKTIVQTVFKKGSFSAIVNAYRDFELPKYIVKSLAIEPDHQYTGISAIDRVVNVANGEVNNTSEDMPKMYMLFDYALLWVAIDGILKKYNVGNYFDFGDPDNSLQNYTIEKIVAGKVAHKINDAISLNRL